MLCFGYGYWSKFVFGDIGILCPQKTALETYTIVGVGAFTVLESMGLEFPTNAVKRQYAGLEAINELCACTNAAILSGCHPGLVMATRQTNLKPLTAYDTQVQSCEFKRGFALPGRVRATRAPIVKGSAD